MILARSSEWRKDQFINTFRRFIIVFQKVRRKRHGQLLQNQCQKVHLDLYLNRSRFNAEKKQTCQYRRCNVYCDLGNKVEV